MSSPASAIATHEKLAASELDYEFDWTSWLVTGDTIQSYTISITGADASLVNGLDVLLTGSKKVRCWLEGGTINKTYRVRCSIVTASTPPRIDARHFDLKVV